MIRHVSVLGAGNAGQALAAYLAGKGLAVTLYNRNAERLRHIRNRTLQVVDAEEKRSAVILEKVTTRLDMALEKAEILFVSTTSLAHGDLARNMAGHLRPHQKIVLHPCRSGGAFEFLRILREISFKQNPVAELETTLFASRLDEEGTIHIYGRKREVHLASLPARETGECFGELLPYIPNLLKAPSVLYTSLSNYGAMLHPAPLLFAASKVENGRFPHRHYLDGFSPSVADLVERMDNERISIGHAYGLHLLPLKHWIASAYDVEGNSLHELIHKVPAYQKIGGPCSIRHRYILEDVATGLVPMIAFARVVGVPTPVMDCVVTNANLLLKEDFYARSRSLAAMGLQGMGRDEIIQVSLYGEVLQTWIRGNAAYSEHPLETAFTPQEF
jgi:opine dehydrogenase